MAISPEALRFDADCMWVDLSDGRTIGVPLAWFPRLLHASPEQRNACEFSRRGMHWPALDEDISVAGPAWQDAAIGRMRRVRRHKPGRSPLNTGSQRRKPVLPAIPS